MTAQHPWPAREAFVAVLRTASRMGYKACKAIEGLGRAGLEVIESIRVHLHAKYMAIGIESNRAEKRAKEQAPRELLRLAAERIGYYADVALALLGVPPATLYGAPLDERLKAATEAYGTTSADYFSRVIRPKILLEVVESLEELVCEPPALMKALQVA